MGSMSAQDSTTCGAVGRKNRGENADRQQEKGDGSEGERVGGADAENEGGDDAAERERTSQAQRDSEENGFHAIGDNHSNNVIVGGAKSDSNADFAEASAHGVGKNAVDADGGEEQRKAGE